MSELEWRAFLEDIREHGLREPLRARGDIILDGRHRLRAGQELGLERVPVVEVDHPPEEDRRFLLRTALARRHLSDGQRATLAAEYAATMARRPGRPRAGQMRTHVDPHSRHPSRQEAASTFAIGPSMVKKALQLKVLSPSLFQDVKSGTLKLGQALAQAHRAAQLAAVARTPAPSGTYRCIVADPPWPFEDQRCSGAAALKYPAMSEAELQALPVEALASPEGCHLYLWTTATHVELAYGLARSWGFDPKTILVWKKPKLGLGRYFRSQAEFVVFAVKGNLPLLEQGLGSLFEARQHAHSEKPDAFFALVERASPGPRIELFARKARPGWTVWGAEAPGSEAEPVIHSSGTEGKSGVQE